MTPPPLRATGLVSFHELAISFPSFRGLRSRVWNRDSSNAPQHPRKPRKSQTAMCGGPGTGDFPDKGRFAAKLVPEQRSAPPNLIERITFSTI